MLTNPNRSFFLGDHSRRRKKKSSTVKLMLNQRSTSNMPQSRGMRSFLPRKPRERFHRITVQRKEYFVLLLFFDLFRRSSCLALIGQMLLKMSPRLYYPHVEPASKERSERHVERKWYRSVQRYPRTDVPRI